MATFEGPMLSLKNINAIAHFTDWIVAHVHVGALGWNGFLTFAVIYWMIPKIYGTTIYSRKLMNQHFWIGTLGILFYAIPMYWSGFTQGLMWKEFTLEGVLKYPNFLQTTQEILPLHIIRALGGTLYLGGFLLMVYNVWKTVAQGKFIANEPAEAPALAKPYTPTPEKYAWHRWIERRPIQMLLASLGVILIGTIIELIPTFTISSNVPTIASVKPYTPLELEGRDLYIREGCNNCHSQMVRPFRSETERYGGEYSKAGEYVYDHPFLWGSKRTGPDLHRLGGKYTHSWHYNHMLAPESMAPGSIMPAYTWLFEGKINFSNIPSKIAAMRKLGVPYPEGYEKQAPQDMKAQCASIAQELAKSGIKTQDDLEIIALIAYLQRLGTDIKPKKELTEK
jgi:cytochrome c oxidase cbb3-type subunit I/II